MQIGAMGTPTLQSTEWTVPIVYYSSNWEKYKEKGRKCILGGSNTAERCENREGPGCSPENTVGLHMFSFASFPKHTKNKSEMEKSFCAIDCTNGFKQIKAIIWQTAEGERKGKQIKVAVLCSSWLRKKKKINIPDNKQ